MRMRALDSVFLGSDTCLDGAKGVDRKKFLTSWRNFDGQFFWRESDDDLFRRMLLDYEVKISTSKDTGHLTFKREGNSTYVDVILYQPTNKLVAEDQQKEQRQYLI